MTPGETVALVSRSGATIAIVNEPDGPRIQVAPKEALTPELLTLLREHRMQVIALIRLLHGDTSPLDRAEDVPGFDGKQAIITRMKLERRARSVHVIPAKQLRLQEKQWAA
jgi:hypothetical protein